MKNNLYNKVMSIDLKFLYLNQYQIKIELLDMF